MKEDSMPDFIYFATDNDVGWELGWEILIARPRIFSGITKIRRAIPEAKFAVVSFTNRHVLYQFADTFIPRGHCRDLFPFSPSDMSLGQLNLVDGSAYKKLDYRNEGIVDGAYALPTIREEWSEKAKSIIQPPYLTISARLRSAEGNRNYCIWGKIAGQLKANGLQLVCTTPRWGAPEMGIPYLEDFIGKDNPDSMRIEMALHRSAEMTITSNTGAAGIMLLSNPKATLIFGGIKGYPPGWDGLHKMLSMNQGYRTRFLDPNLELSGADKAYQFVAADEIIDLILGNLS